MQGPGSEPVRVERGLVRASSGDPSDWERRPNYTGFESPEKSVVQLRKSWGALVGSGAGT